MPCMKLTQALAAVVTPWSKKDWSTFVHHKVSSPVPALRMSVDMDRRSEFQGERQYFLGHFTAFTVLEIVEKGGYFVNNLREIIK